MEKQYLIIAEQISYRNNRLSAINIWDQFLAIAMPSKFNFDLAFACGPGWQAGEYELKFKVKTDAKEEITDLGNIQVNIKDEKSVFNAMASNLNFVLDETAKNITFIVERNGEWIFEREYSVRHLVNIQRQEKEETAV